MAKQMRPMRRSSLIGPWGVGSIVPFPDDETLMIAGLDMWEYPNPAPFRIMDERLCKRLEVQEFRWPVDFRDKSADPDNYGLKIPAVRFPTWYYCPFCGSMKKTSYYSAHPHCDAYQWKNGRKCKPGARQRKMIPERFIVICDNGHISDFPVAEWIHDDAHPYDRNTCRIRRSTGGISSSLAGVTYRCTCGAFRSMRSAMAPGALEKIGFSCCGSKPWFGIETGEEACSGNMRVVLRGATNVWFSNTRSSIRIPTQKNDTDRKIVAIVEAQYNAIKNHRIDGKLDRGFSDMVAEFHKVDKEKLYKAFLEKELEVENLPEVTAEMSEEEYRVAEYQVLINSSGSDGQDFRSINYPSTAYDISIQDFFKSISLVPRLKETRALVGFSRLTPQDMSIEESKKTLRLGNLNWLPAIEVYGEGIFFEFNEEKLKSWAEDPEIQRRALSMGEAYKASFFRRWERGNLRPEYVLIHTFAHVFINQLSYECGYGSSSIRERIYCEQNDNQFNMNGVLIYTASGDSEGSLGGLVRQGEQGRLEDTIISALKNALWCSSDPVCIQSHGQGPDSCNLAACHNCAILPETCCETGNRLLDRGMLIGTIDNPDIGYFSSVRYMQ